MQQICIPLSACYMWRIVAQHLAQQLAQQVVQHVELNVVPCEGTFNVISDESPLVSNGPDIQKCDDCLFVGERGIMLGQGD